MTIDTITAPLTPITTPVPSSADPDNFDPRADVLFATDVPRMVSEWNVVVAAINTMIGQINTTSSSLNAAITGGAWAIDYFFSTTTTMADPTSGYLRLNNATQNTATSCVVDVLSADGADYTNALNLLDDSTSDVKGVWTIRHRTDGTKFLIFNVTALTTPAGYRQITLDPQASSTANPFANNDPITVTFSRTGDKGLKGDKGDAGDISAGGTAGGNISMADYQLSRAMIKDSALVAVDKGNSSTTAQTYDYTAGSVQKITATGNHPYSFSNWPPTGNRGILLQKIVNGGAYTLTPPTVYWQKPDGTETTSFSTYLAANTGRVALQTSGEDEILYWTDDAGTKVKGKLV